MDKNYFGVNIDELGASYPNVLMSSFRQGLIDIVIYISDSKVFNDYEMKDFLKRAVNTGYSVTICTTKSQLPPEKSISWRTVPIP